MDFFDLAESIKTELSKYRTLKQNLSTSNCFLESKQKNLTKTKKNSTIFDKEIKTENIEKLTPLTIENDPQLVEKNLSLLSAILSPQTYQTLELVKKDFSSNEIPVSNDDFEIDNFKSLQINKINKITTETNPHNSSQTTCISNFELKKKMPKQQKSLFNKKNIENVKRNNKKNSFENIKKNNRSLSKEGNKKNLQKETMKKRDSSLNNFTKNKLKNSKTIKTIEKIEKNEKKNPDLSLSSIKSNESENQNNFFSSMKQNPKQSLAYLATNEKNLEIELEKWKNFSAVLAENYESTNKKYKELLNEKSQYMSIINALEQKIKFMEEDKNDICFVCQEKSIIIEEKEKKFVEMMSNKEKQIVDMQQELANFKDEQEDFFENQLNLMNSELEKYKQKLSFFQEENDRYKEAFEKKQNECKILAEQLISQNNDLDKSNNNIKKFTKGNILKSNSFVLFSASSNKNSKKSSPNLTSKLEKNDSKRTVFSNFRRNSKTLRMSQLSNKENIGEEEDLPPSPTKILINPEHI